MSVTPPARSEDSVREPGASRRGQLALALQEVLTATVRLRSGRQVATDAEAFRAHVKKLLGTAERDGRRLGYASDDVALALYAAVVLLDESVLNSALPMFASWPNRPLQEEIFGGHMGGEIFFQHLRQVLTREESEDQADLLEVFLLCLLLGFRGRYGANEQGELRTLIAAAEDKIRRVRGAFGELTPGWTPPVGETVARTRDRWLPWLAGAAAIMLLMAGLLFGLFRSSLGAATDQIRQTLAQPSG